MILIQLLLDNADKVLELFLVLAAIVLTVTVGDDCRGYVTKDPWTGGLDRINKGRGKEQLQKDVLRILEFLRILGVFEFPGICVVCVVKEREESPVN